jgi:hypothetical protein
MYTKTIFFNEKRNFLLAQLLIKLNFLLAQ